MTKKTPAKQSTSMKRLALFGLLTTLPVAATATLIAHGDTILWSQIERGLGKIGIATTLAQSYDCNGQWSNNPDCNLTVSDCDCSDSDSDSDGVPSGYSYSETNLGE